MVFEKSLKNYKNVMEFIVDCENSIMSFRYLINSIKIICGYNTDEKALLIVNLLKKENIVEINSNLKEVEDNQVVMILPSIRLKRLVKLHKIFGDELK